MIWSECPHCSAVSVCRRRNEPKTKRSTGHQDTAVSTTTGQVGENTPATGYQELVPTNASPDKVTDGGYLHPLPHQVGRESEVSQDTSFSGSIYAEPYQPFAAKQNEPHYEEINWTMQLWLIWCIDNWREPEHCKFPTNWLHDLAEQFSKSTLSVHCLSIDWLLGIWFDLYFIGKIMSFPCPKQICSSPATKIDWALCWFWWFALGTGWAQSTAGITWQKLCTADSQGKWCSVVLIFGMLPCSWSRMMCQKEFFL